MIGFHRFSAAISPGLGDRTNKSATNITLNAKTINWGLIERSLLGPSMGWELCFWIVTGLAGRGLA